MRRNCQVKKVCVAIAAEQCCCNGQNQAGGALPSPFAVVEQQRYAAEFAAISSVFEVTTCDMV